MNFVGILVYIDKGVLGISRRWKLFFLKYKLLLSS